MGTISYVFIAGLVAVAYLAYQRASQTAHGKLPPGPKPAPFLGNIADFPPKGTPDHLHWLKHKDIYGPISSVSVLGMTMVIVHDRDIARSLLEQASSKTSGRPEMVMANKLCGYEAILICQNYTPAFRQYRKFLHQELGTKASTAQFTRLQEDEVKRQLLRALKEPHQWLHHYKTTSAASALKMAYGYNIEQDKPDKLITMVDKMMQEFALAASPMAWAVDIIPALRHLPDSFPGASFKKTAKKWRKSIQACAYLPYEFVQRQMDAQGCQLSYVSKLIEKSGAAEVSELTEEDEEAVIWSAASLYGAAADTMVITLTSFTLAMVMFPEVQKKAQDEIDRVIGLDRLPTLEDREQLPYLEALVKESLRWWPIASMGFPHVATEDLECQGYHIPKGAMILPAVWWYLHDPNVYSQPESFDPSRFLAPRNEPDPSPEAFGFGRRMCPGRFFAENGLYLNFAATLATMKISKAIGADGKEVEVDVKPKPGVLTYSTDFEFKVEPRSEKHRQLIERLEVECPFEASDADLIGDIESFQIRY